MARWFRMHESTLDDPKVQQRLSDSQFRAWVNLLCLACRHDGVLPPLRDIAFALRKSENEASKIIEALIRNGLIDKADGPFETFTPHNWNGRQYVSDSSSNRVKQFRERRRNVSVTPSEAETEAETEKEKNSAAKASPSAKRGTRLPDDWALTAELRDFASDLGLDPEVTLAEFADYWRGVPGARGCKLDWPATFRNRCRELAARPKARGPIKPTMQTLAPDPTSADWKGRVDWFRNKGMWNPNWGPKPDEAGCFAPKELLQ